MEQNAPTAGVFFFFYKSLTLNGLREITLVFISNSFYSYLQAICSIVLYLSARIGIRVKFNKGLLYHEE